VNTNTTPKLPLKELKGPRVKVILSNKITAQIASLHRHIKEVEWSGFITYKLKDNITIEEIIKDGGEILVDSIFPLNVGSSAYTDFDTDITGLPEALQNKLLNGYMKGYMHTHHSMDTFFSGTDESELRTNAPETIIYLSIIVNFRNGGNPIARLCFNGEENSSPVIKLFGKEITQKPNTIKYVYYYNCDVVYEEEEAIVKSIKEIREKNKPVQPTLWGGNPYGGYYNNGYNRHHSSYDANMIGTTNGRKNVLSERERDSKWFFIDLDATLKGKKVAFSKRLYTPTPHQIREAWIGIVNSYNKLKEDKKEELFYTVLDKVDIEIIKDAEEFLSKNWYYVSVSPGINKKIKEIMNELIEMMDEQNADLMDEYLVEALGYITKNTEKEIEELISAQTDKEKKIAINKIKFENKTSIDSAFTHMMFSDEAYLEILEEFFEEYLEHANKKKTKEIREILYMIKTEIGII